MSVCVHVSFLFFCDICGLKKGIRFRELVNSNRESACETDCPTRHNIYTVALLQPYE